MLFEHSNTRSNGIAVCNVQNIRFTKTTTIIGSLRPQGCHCTHHTAARNNAEHTLGQQASVDTSRLGKSGYHNISLTPPHCCFQNDAPVRSYIENCDDTPPLHQTTLCRACEHCGSNMSLVCSQFSAAAEMCAVHLVWSEPLLHEHVILSQTPCSLYPCPALDAVVHAHTRLLCQAGSAQPILGPTSNCFLLVDMHACNNIPDTNLETETLSQSLTAHSRATTHTTTTINNNYSLIPP